MEENPYNDWSDDLIPGKWGQKGEGQCLDQNLLQKWVQQVQVGGYEPGDWIYVRISNIWVYLEGFQQDDQNFALMWDAWCEEEAQLSTQHIIVCCIWKCEN